MEEYIELDKELACMADECAKDAVPPKYGYTLKYANNVYKKLFKNELKPNKTKLTYSKNNSLKFEFYDSQRELDCAVQSNNSAIEEIVIKNSEDVTIEDDVDAVHEKTTSLLSQYDPERIDGYTNKFEGGAKVRIRKGIKHAVFKYLVKHDLFNINTILMKQ